MLFQVGLTFGEDKVVHWAVRCGLVSLGLCPSEITVPTLLLPVYLALDFV